jgi:hypothetical protein
MQFHFQCYTAYNNSECLFYGCILLHTGATSCVLHKSSNLIPSRKRLAPPTNTLYSCRVRAMRNRIVPKRETFILPITIDCEQPLARFMPNVKTSLERARQGRHYGALLRRRLEELLNDAVRARGRPNALKQEKLLATLCAGAKAMALTKKQIIFTQEDAAETVFHIQEGKGIRVYQEHDESRVLSGPGNQNPDLAEHPSLKINPSSKRPWLPLI